MSEWMKAFVTKIKKHSKLLMILIKKYSTDTDAAEAKIKR